MTGRAVVLRGDARALPLADESVDLVVTSPPYYALRAYTDGGQVYDGQIGSEATPAQYIATLVECTREWVRVLKPCGSLFVNLGDKYAAHLTGQPPDKSLNTRKGRTANYRPGMGHKPYGVEPKSLLGLPWRYALACIDQLGLILRAEMVWSKPNGLPESVADRVRRSHEQWFHLTRRPRYYSAVDEIREPHAPWRASGANGLAGQQTIRQRGQQDPDQRNSLGKLPGSVWDIASEPLRVPDHLGIDHFAAFPTEWPRRIIQGWSPPGICTVCGEGRRPVAGREYIKSPKHANGSIIGSRRGTTRGWDGLPRINAEHTITGYACACPQPTAPTRPAVILDPFGGTGTVALVAAVLGRTGISVDYSADYTRLARWRTADPGERARAMRVAKPPAQAAGQTSLFDLGVAP